MGKKLKQRRKQKSYQNFGKMNKGNGSKIEDYLWTIIVIIIIIYAIISSFLYIGPGYNWAKGWGFYEWFIEKTR